MSLRWPDNSTTPTRAELTQTRAGTLYLESWFLMRLVVGILGVVMPLALVVGNALLFPGASVPLGSLSAYYHTGMRDVFFGILWVIGVFLITYMSFHWNWDNVITIGAGVAAIIVAICPTTAPADGIQTPLQQKFGQGVVSHVHFGAAAAFVVLLAIMSFRFGLREDEIGRNRSWRILHWACGAVILAAVVFLAVADFSGLHTIAGLSVLLIVEVVTTLAFGVSWLVKGGELSTTLVSRGLYGEAAEAERLAASSPSRSPAGASP